MASNPGPAWKSTNAGPPEATRSATRPVFLIGLVLFSIALAAGLFELGCQLYSIYLYREFDRLRQQPEHFFAASDNPILCYELAGNRVLDLPGRRLRINRYGIRDDSDDLARDKLRVAILGDSVVFGIAHSQEETVPSLLQRALDGAASRVRVFNFGVPGYGLGELGEFLKVKNAIYAAHVVVYVLNANDFTRRDSIYEGADNGLYRMYRRPFFKSPLFLYKVAYRLQKKGLVNPPVSWYQWLFAGNREFGCARIEEMAAYAKQHQLRFYVVLMPAGSAFRQGHYELAAMYRELSQHLAAKGIVAIDATPQFADHPEKLQDETDHLRPPGDAVMAGVVADLLRAQNALPATP